MFKKIREKWNKQIEKAEKRDIEFIKRHPKIWKTYMLGFLSFFIIVSIFSTITEPSFIIMILIFTIPVYMFEKEMLDRYKKAHKQM